MATTAVAVAAVAVVASPAVASPLSLVLVVLMELEVVSIVTREYGKRTSPRPKLNLISVNSQNYGNKLHG